MLKTISAALLAASVIAAPALAADSSKTTQAPAGKTVQAPAGKTVQAPADKTAQVKPNAANANAKMVHHRYYRHHRAPKHMGALKTHKFSKVTNKHVTAVSKRG
jgi:hypothetical protein